MPRLALPCAVLLGAVPVPIPVRALFGQEPAPPQPLAQQPAAPTRPLQGEPQPPVVVTAARYEQDPFTSPYAIDVVDARRIEQRGYRSLPQALRDVPGVLLQETSPGQGSPFLRGFTGYQNLLLIDGVRLNNSVFRSGPNQYWSTVDPLSIERIEVLKGPAGAQYGSDAIGGTVQVFTKNPYAFGDGRMLFAGSSFVRLASAENSVWGRAEISGGQLWNDGTRTGFLLGGDAKYFGDFEGGHATGTQPDTGYDETAFDLKVEHWLDGGSRLVFLHQRVDQNDVPRTHATSSGISWRGTAIGTDRQRDLDQNRTLTYLQYHRTGMAGTVEGIHGNLSWHRQIEDENRIRSNGNPETQGFTVDTLGAWLQLEHRPTSLGRFSYGVEYYRDQVDSYLRRTPVQPGDYIQGPVADDASYDLVGVFVQDVIQLGDGVELTLGARYTYAAASADAVRDPQTSTQIAIRDHWDRVTGNARLRIDLIEDRWNVYGGVSQGFRAPNLSDLTRFDIARSGEAEIPAPRLDPENYLSYEVGTKVRTGDVSLQATWFYTDIEDQILRFPTGAVTGGNEPIVTKANVGDGYIQGVEVGGSFAVLPQTELFGAFAWQYGRITNYDAGGTSTTEEYPSRLLPTSSMLGIRWQGEQNPVYVETMVLRAEEADRLSAADRRDTQRIPPGGTASYTIWNASAGVEIDERTTLDVGIQNITDVDYRVHGSGSNAVGRNLYVAMHVRF